MTYPVFVSGDSDAVAFFDEHGFVLTRTLDVHGANQLRGWVDDVMQWADDGQWLHYREMTEFGPKLCRTENFVPFHDGLRALLTRGAMIETASALLHEPAVLYKEKINYKAAGGAGFAPHQDAPAYRFIENHISCMMSIDDADADNGCLEVVAAHYDHVLATDDNGCIRADVVAQLEWELVEVVAGSTLWFHSRTPHRSGPNRSSRDRRALYPTYNAASEGDLRAAYYEQKRSEFAASGALHTTNADRVQVSLINDFQGRPVTGA